MSPSSPQQTKLIDQEQASLRRAHERLLKLEETMAEMMLDPWGQTEEGVAWMRDVTQMTRARDLYCQLPQSRMTEYGARYESSLLKGLDRAECGLPQAMEREQQFLDVISEMSWTKEERKARPSAPAPNQPS